MPVAQEKVKVTPFQIFLRELKKRRADMTTSAITVACIAFSTRVMTLKNEMKSLHTEYEERFADLQADNQKLKDQLENLREKVMEEADKSGRKLEPLVTRLSAIFDDVPVARKAATNSGTEGTLTNTGTEGDSKKKELGKFFV